MRLNCAYLDLLASTTSDRPKTSLRSGDNSFSLPIAEYVPAETSIFTVYANLGKGGLFVALFKLVRSVPGRWPHCYI